MGSDTPPAKGILEESGRIGCRVPSSSEAPSPLSFFSSASEVSASEALSVPVFPVPGLLPVSVLPSSEESSEPVLPVSELLSFEESLPDSECSAELLSPEESSLESEASPELLFPEESSLESELSPELPSSAESSS